MGSVGGDAALIEVTLTSHSGMREPVLRASRDLRIEALQEATYIIKLLMDEANAKIQAIQRAKQLVTELSAKRAGNS